MVTRLSKGQGLSLDSSAYDLSLVTIGLGWDIARSKQGLVSGVIGAKSSEYDLDLVAFLCGRDGKIHNLGQSHGRQPNFQNSDVIFFNNQKHYSGDIWLTKDNRTGEGDGDDEQIIVKLDDLSVDYHKIIFIAQIFDGIKNNQHFGEMSNAYLRAVDASGHELVRFDLSDTELYIHQCSVLFAELVRTNSGWEFKAVGQPSSYDSFVEWLKSYI
ncbi:TerD family protein [Acinetobacter stercoris]|uniref:Stress response protein SCP2 n=1 Tax=Acinetobacter stercoris TaxID=2126983 RepID=A0A2U3N3Z0_9GAMM|nr:MULTISPECIES: TerD family protein [Acinetobacter]SPL72396.1 Stress response protein SCP2 [Acinetobacter stercoris]